MIKVSQNIDYIIVWPFPGLQQLTWLRTSSSCTGNSSTNKLRTVTVTTTTRKVFPLRLRLGKVFRATPQQTILHQYGAFVRVHAIDVARTRKRDTHLGACPQTSAVCELRFHGASHNRVQLSVVCSEISPGYRYQ